MTDKKTRRRGRKNRRRARGTSGLCESLGHDWEMDAYKSAMQPSGIIIEKCKRCPRERAARVPRF